MKTNHKHKLPFEYPLKKAIKIYLRRIAVAIGILIAVLLTISLAYLMLWLFKISFHKSLILLLGLLLIVVSILRPKRNRRKLLELFSKKTNLIAFALLIITFFSGLNILSRNKKPNQVIEGGSSRISSVSQDDNITVFGVSRDVHEEARKEAEAAKRELEKLKKYGSLSATAKRVLAEAEEAKEKGDKELYLEKIQEYRQVLNDEPIKRAAEAWVLEGQVLFSQFRLEEAQKAAERAVELDPSNPEYLITLGEYLFSNGKYQKMEEVSLKAISLIKKQEPIDEILLGTSLNSLGLAYLNRGKYDLAVEPFQQALEMTRKQLGEEHPKVASNLNNLAVLYKSQGRYSEAEPLYLQALDIAKKTLGEEHPDVAIRLNNLALLYESQGRYSKAKPLFQEALSITKATLGEEHPDVAINLNNLALLYESQGRYLEAEPLYLQALDIAIKTLGEEHPNTNTIQANYKRLKEK